jgi:hypothetical protein
MRPYFGDKAPFMREGAYVDAPLQWENLDGILDGILDEGTNNQPH